MSRRRLPAATFSMYDDLEARAGNFARHRGSSDSLFGELQLTHRGALGGSHRS
ncbi:MAG TPA: hypothetical protein VIH92_11865 [Solirubrobacteraceae bacterium]